MLFLKWAIKLLQLFAPNSVTLIYIKGLLYKITHIIWRRASWVILMTVWVLDALYLFG